MIDFLDSYAGAIKAASPGHLSRAQQKELLEKWVAGDEQARNDLFLSVALLVMSLVRRRMKRRPQDAEDVLQDAYLMILERVERYDPSKASACTFFGWYAVCASSRHLVRARQLNRLTPIGDRDFIDSHEAALYDDQADIARQRIQALPDRWQHVLLMRLEGRTLQQIGDCLGITRERARQLEKKGLELLQANSV